MSLQSRREYLEKVRPRYQRGGRQHRQKILDEFCVVYECHRKHAIRLLNKDPAMRQRRGPAVRYDEPVRDALKIVWLKSNQLCSKLLKAALPAWVDFLKLPWPVRDKVLAVSPATIDRLLKPLRVQYARRRRCGTKPGTLLKKEIPIRTHHDDADRPGFIEADTVAHCGSSMSGDFVWTLTFTDVHTGWTQCRAVWNRGQTGIHEQIKSLEAESPFALLEFDCDNGGEFLNHALARYFGERTKVVGFTRSRPYHKNDNAHVEQKNWTHVRELFGYERFDAPELVALMNDLYSQEWHWMQNFYRPMFKLQRKTKLGSKYVKTYYPPETAYARLLRSDEVPAEKKEELRAIHKGLNPLKLAERIQAKAARISRELKRLRAQSKAG
jgi:hypothetical protein